MSMFSAQKIREAIERCNAQCVSAIANHEPQERIDGMRAGIDKLHQWLAKAEREEREAAARN